MNAELGRSKRGGGSAPGHCKTSLRSCMINGSARDGLRKAAKSCMSAFNECRTGGKKKRTTKKRTAKRRKAKR